MPFLGKSNPFLENEHTSLEIFWELICCDSCIDIFLYISLLFVTVYKFVFELTKFGNSGWHLEVQTGVTNANLVNTNKKFAL